MPAAAAPPDLDLSPMLRPFACGSLRLRDRWAMAPMTREWSPENLLTEEAPAYYARRAAGGCGLIVTEGAAVPHPLAHESANIPEFGGASLPRWGRVAAAVHAAGGAIFAQLWHAGLYRRAADTRNPQDLSIAPSVVGQSPVREMMQADIDAVVAAYGQAASDALALGFDGVEVHGAHGYLPDQFFWPKTNRRADGYGGPIANRVRFAVELVAEIRRRTRPDFPIMFRFSQWKGTRYDARIAETPQELEAWLVPLADAGVDIFDASTRRFWQPEFDGSALNLAGWAKKLTGRAAMTVGSVGLEGPLEVGRLSDHNGAAVSLATLGRLAEMMARDEIDLAALGRVLLANPEWPTLVREGRFEAIRPYDAAALTRGLETAG